MKKTTIKSFFAQVLPVIIIEFHQNNQVYEKIKFPI